MSGQRGVRMSISPKAQPLTAAELVELRALRDELRSLLPKMAPLAQDVPCAEAARRLGLTSRTVRELAKAGELPGAWKPAENRLHIPVKSIEAYKERRAVVINAGGKL